MKGVRIETSAHDDVVVATLDGEIDVVNHAEVSAALLEAALAGGPLFVTDLNAVDYVDSNGVRMFFDVARELQRSRIAWAAVLAPDAPLQRLLQVTAFDGTVQIFPSLAAATTALKTQG